MPPVTKFKMVAYNNAVSNWGLNKLDARFVGIISGDFLRYRISMGAVKSLTLIHNL